MRQLHKWINRLQLYVYGKRQWTLFLVLFVAVGSVLAIPVIVAETAWDSLSELIRQKLS